MDKKLTNINHDTYVYLTNKNQINGVVHISHGMAEHIGRYKWLIEKLNDDGYHVISIDHRGNRKNITNFEIYKEKLKQRLDPSVTIMQGINSQIKKTNKKIVFADGED